MGRSHTITRDSLRTLFEPHVGARINGNSDFWTRTRVDIECGEGMKCTDIDIRRVDDQAVERLFSATLEVIPYSKITSVTLREGFDNPVGVKFAVVEALEVAA